ncbi:hypothetical protein JCM8547_007409 [Rhodosporidiobolus lusitaniae]
MSMLPNSLLNAHSPKAQFRAVVFCGLGVDLFPLVEPSADLSSDEEEAKPGLRSHGRGHGQTKALLPVAGRKMVDWVLERVEEAGVFDILVLTPQSIAKPLAHHLRARRSQPSSSSSGATSTHSAKVELEEIPEEFSSKGCVRVLKWAAEKGLITTDFILLPCDLLLASTPSPSSSPISLASLLDRHRTDDNLMTTLFSERPAGNVVEARKDGPAEVLTIYDQKTSTLLDVREMDEFDDDEVPLRTSLLNKFPALTLTTTILPTQLYIFSSLLLPVLRSPDHSRRLKHMDNFRELAGWVSRLSWRNKGRDALGVAGKAEQRRSKEDGLAMGRSATQKPEGLERRHKEGGERKHVFEAPSYPPTGANTPALVSRASWRPDLGSTERGSGFSTAGEGAGLGEIVGGKKVSAAQARAGAGGCKIVVWRASDGFAARGNTVQGWVEINRAALRLLPPSPPPTNTPSGVFISPDSYLHSSVYGAMGEKVGVKRCIIGKNTAVGKGSKLTNCVIMEGAVIGENVKLDNCVVSNGVQIRDRAQLKDCEIGRDVIVDADSQLKGEQLVVEVD